MSQKKKKRAQMPHKQIFHHSYPSKLGSYEYKFQHQRIIAEHATNSPRINQFLDPGNSYNAIFFFYFPKYHGKKIQGKEKLTL